MTAPRFAPPATDRRLRARALRPGVVAVGAASLTLLALASPAHAATFCVGKPACQGTVMPTIEAALKATNLPANPGPDRVELGEGEFSGPANVLEGSGAELVGSGRGKSIIVGAGGTPALASYDDNTHISDLTVRMSDANYVGIDGNDPGLLLERIEVQGPPTQRASKAGVMLRRGGTVRDAIIDMDPAASPVNYGISLQPDPNLPKGEVVIENVRASGGYAAYVAAWPAPVTIRGAILTGGVFGVAVGLPTPQLRLDTIAARVVHSGPYDAGAGLGISTGIAAPGGSSTITARHLTLVSRARGGNGIEVRADAGQTVTVNARETLALGGADWRPPVVRTPPGGGDPIVDSAQTTSSDIEMSGGGTVDLHLADSAWRGGATAIYAANGRLREDGGNVDLDHHGQVLADPDGGNLSPSGGSVLIDNAGRDADPGPDAAGNTRPVDGDGDGDVRADIGAYEAAAGSSAGHATPYLQPGSCDAACTQARRDAITKQLPVSAAHKPGKRRVRRISGTSQRADRVRVSVTRIRGRSCQALDAKGHWSRAGKPARAHCPPRFLLLAEGSTTWSLKLRRALPAGRYEIATQAVNALGLEVQPLRRSYTLR